MRRLFLVGILLMPQLGVAADDVATFAAFYQPSGVVNWLLISLVAVAAGAAIIFSGGTASPAVAAIGSWVGGTMGLSGAAATKAGLALLGGGAIASGGFGIVGGTALLTAALTFSTEVVFDYSLGTLYAKYQYHDLVERSKNLTTLPLPRSTVGLENRIDALDGLDDVDQEKPLLAPGNIELIRKAIAGLERAAKGGELDEDDMARAHSLSSLLLLITNDYEGAREHAGRAMAVTANLGLASTLPAFIYATAGLYDERFDWQSSGIGYFRASLVGEPDNKLIPLLVTIYADRLSLRMDDGSVGPESLASLRALVNDPVLEKFRTVNLVGLTGRYFVRLKLAQQKIGALAMSNSEVIQSDRRSISVLDKALADYAALLKGAESTLSDLKGANLSREDGHRVQVFWKLLLDYSRDRDRLAGLVTEFRERQAPNRALTSAEPSAEGGSLTALVGGLLWLLLVPVAVVKAWRAMKKP